MSSPSNATDISLKVAEGRLQDVGRGLARLDPADISRLGISIGNLVQIGGKKTTAAKVLPAFRDARGKQLIQIDGITRSNAGVVIGEKVALAPLQTAVAQRIVLAPEGADVLRKATGEYLTRFLTDMPVTTGDRIRVVLFGSRFQEFRILETMPRGTVIVRRETAIRIEVRGSSSDGLGRVSYEDIGGLGSAIQRVREMIELPLRYPEIFGRLGIDPPKGVLLHGPPGCGKTLLARAVANETNASFFAISGPEIVSKYYGESEAKLRQLFEQAKKESPSIIFLDEIDSIAPKRENTTGEVEKRIVAQLLAIMDGLEARGQITVIAATNLPNVLDPALRRPGRFDREIVIGTPDVQGRREMLEIHTRGMPLSGDINLQVLAEITHGFTGADMAALCREAAMAALRRVLPRVDFNPSSFPYEQLLQLHISMDDFSSALRDVEPSGLREVLVEVPDVGWDDIGGLEKVKSELREIVEWPVRHQDLYELAQLRPPRGILLSGPPGTGKTLLARAVAKELGINFIAVKGPELLSKYVGESEKGLREIFCKARQAAPCVIFFDEIDALVPRRGTSSNDGHVGERIVAQMLSEMDGIEGLEGVLVLAATNRHDMIDPALLRPGRFDRLIELGRPDESDRLSILEVHNRCKPLGSDVDLKELARETHGFTGADLEKLSQEAAMAAVRDFLALERGQETLKFEVSERHYRWALSAMTTASQGVSSQS
jgi:transitional endoplasmic reticulum ATPase